MVYVTRVNLSVENMDRYFLQKNLMEQFLQDFYINVDTVHTVEEIYNVPTDVRYEGYVRK